MKRIDDLQRINALYNEIKNKIRNLTEEKTKLETKVGKLKEEAQRLTLLIKIQSSNYKKINCLINNGQAQSFEINNENISKSKVLINLIISYFLSKEITEISLEEFNEIVYSSNINKSTCTQSIINLFNGYLMQIYKSNEITDISKKIKLIPFESNQINNNEEELITDEEKSFVNNLIPTNTKEKVAS